MTPQVTFADVCSITSFLWQRLGSAAIEKLAETQLQADKLKVTQPGRTNNLQPCRSNTQVRQGCKLFCKLFCMHCNAVEKNELSYTDDKSRRAPIAAAATAEELTCGVVLPLG